MAVHSVVCHLLPRRVPRRDHGGLGVGTREAAVGGRDIVRAYPHFWQRGGGGAHLSDETAHHRRERRPLTRDGLDRLEALIGARGSPIVAAPPLGGPVRPRALAYGEAVEGPPRARCHPEVGIDLMRGVERAPHEALLYLLSREAVGFLERRPHAWRLGLGEPAEDRLEAGVVPAVVEALEGMSRGPVAPTEYTRLRVVADGGEATYEAVDHRPARVAALRQILTSDPGVSPADSDKGRAQPHDLGSVAVSGPDPYATPNNGADRVPDMHQLSPELGPGQAPLSHSTAVSSGRPSQAPSGGERSALPLLLTLTNPEATTAPEAAWGGDPNPDIRGASTQASVSPEPGGEPSLRRVHLGRKGEMGSIPHPKEVCEHPNSHAERKLRDRWDAALRLFSTGGIGDILCEIAAKEAAGESRVNAARLALEDLARFEGSDPQLSLFRRRLDGTLAIAGARLGAAQQAAVEVNPSGIAVSRFPTAAGFLSLDLGLPVGSETHFFLNPAQIPKRLVAPSESKARHPWPPFILICLEMAAGFEPSLFTTDSPGYPRSWPTGGYDGLACDGADSLCTMMIAAPGLEQRDSSRPRKGCGKAPAR
eukprot:scaffold7414_cov119-Isochrysis_galbana.AAC.2